MGGQIMTKPLGQLSQAEKSDKKEPKIIWSKKEKEESKEKYGCEIVIENGSLNEVMTIDAPSDAWIVTYEVEGEVHRDLTRGTRVKLFDMYYDKFKMGVKIIDYGKGTIKPVSYTHLTLPTILRV